MARIAGMLLGFVCLIIGIIGMLTPIPFGIVFMVLAFLLLIPTTPGATRMIKHLRRKSPRFVQMMAAVITRLPLPYRRILRRTDIHAMDQMGF